MLAHAQSGDTVFTACLRLFRSYPLAVRRHYAEHRYGSMVLMNRDAGTARYCVLIMERDDLFTIAPWDRREWARAEIRPRGPVDASVRWLIMSGVPVLRDGVLLGWVAGQQVRAVLAAHGRVPEPWDDASVVPGILVMPRAGSQAAERPPLTAVQLDGLGGCGSTSSRASWRTSPRWSRVRWGGCSGCRARVGSPADGRAAASS